MACTTEVSLAVSRLADNCATNGGLTATAWIINTDDCTGVTVSSTTKEVQTFTLASGKNAYKWVGKSKSWGFTSSKAADSKAWVQTVSLVFNVATALEMFNFEELNAAKSLIIIVQDNNESFKIFGLGLDSTGGIASLNGLDQAEGNVDIPVEVTGDTTARLNRIGDINNTYKFFNTTTGTVAANIAYLDGLLA